MKEKKHRYTNKLWKKMWTHSTQMWVPPLDAKNKNQRREKENKKNAEFLGFFIEWEGSLKVSLFISSKKYNIKLKKTAVLLTIYKKIIIKH